VKRHDQSQILRISAYPPPEETRFVKSPQSCGNSALDAFTHLMVAGRRGRGGRSVPGQRPEVAEPVGGGTAARRLPMADQFSPQPCSPFRIAAHRVQQQRPTKAACSAAVATSSAWIAGVGRERLIGRAVQSLLSLLLIRITSGTAAC
jgi:hypothetical protein